MHYDVYIAVGDVGTLMFCALHPVPLIVVTVIHVDLGESTSYQVSTLARQTSLKLRGHGGAIMTCCHDSLHFSDADRTNGVEAFLFYNSFTSRK